MEVILGDWDKAEIPPGFGHTMTAIATCIVYCLQNDLYLVINDDNWCYGGRWIDYFEPFWDEAEKQRVLSLGLEKIVVDTNLNDEYGYGLKFWHMPDIRQKYQAIVFDILVPNQKMKKVIDEKSVGLQDIDIAFELRLGYEVPAGRLSLQDYQAKILPIIYGNNLPQEKIFILTDTYSSVEYFKKIFGDKVYTLCPPEYNGIVATIRNRKDENLPLVLAKLFVAARAKYYIGKMRGLSELIYILRQSKNCFLI